MVKEQLHGTPWRVRYYRDGSAASRLSPADLDSSVIADAKVLHLTGITPALGPSALATVLRAVEIAQQAGTLVVIRCEPPSCPVGGR
jgi:2-dehydro-3-deoxygluconokinase